jgi:integrase
MTINFYLNNDTRSKRKEIAIFCYIRESGQTLTLHTGERIEPKFCDTQKQKVKRTYVGSPELKDYLENYKEKIKKIIRTAKTDDPFLPFEQIRKIILKEVKNKTGIDFYQVFDLFIETRKPQVSKATTGKYQTIKKHIRGLADKEKINVTFDTIDLTFFYRLQNYFQSVGISNNTIHKNMQFFKSFLHWSYEREYTKNNKFEDYKNPKLIETDNIALTKKDLNKILNCTLNQRLDKVRDIFLFQLYTGQRFSDINNFKYNDVKIEIWYLRQTKTKKVIEIPLIKPALKILRKYGNKLPIITNQKMNEYLKELGENAGLTEKITITKYQGADRKEIEKYKYELLTTHTARRTFVSLASYNGVNQQVVKAYTGHSTDRMVDKYFKKNNSESKKIIENIFVN